MMSFFYHIRPRERIELCLFIYFFLIEIAKRSRNYTCLSHSYCFHLLLFFTIETKTLPWHFRVPKMILLLLSPVNFYFPIYISALLSCSYVERLITIFFFLFLFSRVCQISYTRRTPSTSIWATATIRYHDNLQYTFWVIQSYQLISSTASLHTYAMLVKTTRTHHIH